MRRPGLSCARAVAGAKVKAVETHARCAEDARRSKLPVHSGRVSQNGLVYVCDRQHSRVQVFQTSGAFVREVILPSEGGLGSASGVEFSADPEQRYLHVTGGGKIWILRRSDLQLRDSFDSVGGHYIGVDSKGNIYTNGGRGPDGQPRPLRYLLTSQ